MTIKKRNLVLLLIVAFLLGGTIAAGSVILIENGVLGGTVKVSKKNYNYYQKLDERYGKLDQLYDELENSFYKKPDEEQMATGMYKGLVAGLGDPYSAYMTKEEYTSWTDSTLGEFDGVGITFSTNKNGEYVVVNTIPDTPAEKAGLEAGDILLAVNDKTYSTMDTFSAALKGKAGTKVKLTYARDGKEKNVVMKRATIVNKTIESEVLKDQIGYIKISSFEEHTADDFKSALSNLQKKQVKGLVIDLRENGGGIVDAGIQVADELLGEGTVTYLQDQHGKRQYLKSEKSKIDIPYVLLVDENTASTSEIIAAAVKDDGKNPLVGTTTFGKGIVQSTGELSDGSALKLTTMQYFSPKGHVINGKGIKPTYEVKNDKKSKTDKQLNKALELLKAK
ncbi:S41 family peptidase [Ihubacter massiliensis]|uniref:S41 family peptidase n=1 Tax=Hominibacterium faecale TaxID=2839743 RepID=A0A9J6QMC0_9FIRM|nr:MULTISPECIES: S41 family peptidase [Eubacteriales Family XIII. Incertae Sedis]MCI7303167.1 S41 family peptidase [Clostridia bacterium]MCO7121343.1 S41 family peptidase [Ihubacter massiliensis]MCU7378329.1 S41 family peptidase [Hominibacterium faecale]MDY3012836.1 S41 family peptidase [Clostridiales Family XIII bacterium]